MGSSEECSDAGAVASALDFRSGASAVGTASAGVVDTAAAGCAVSLSLDRRRGVVPSGSATVSKVTAASLGAQLMVKGCD